MSVFYLYACLFLYRTLHVKSSRVGETCFCMKSYVGYDPVASQANPLPVFVEVGVLRVLPRSAVVSFVVALTTTIAVIPYCCTERNHSRCRVTLALLVVFLVPEGLVECSFTASPVRQVVVLLPLVDQSLANEQELLEGFLILVHFVLPQCLLELSVKHRI